MRRSSLRTPGFRLILATPIAVVLSAILIAQSATPQQPTFKAQANFVRVDVYPTRDGKPVDDLRADDFEILEDDAPQSISSFEHVVIPPAAPGGARSEPATAAESRQLAADGRSRVFVLFLDLPHVSLEASRDTAGPLIRLLDRLLGPADLIGLMTPDMSPSDLILARKTEVLESSLQARLAWGQRSRSTERQRVYDKCYAVLAPQRADELALRAQERATLETLDRLVEYLRIVRDERKAVLTISEGWQLYRPTDTLTTLNVADPRTGATEPVPGPGPISAGPDGKPTTSDKRSANPADRSACEQDRLRLSSIDDSRFFQDLIDAANRANTSFYTIDPRAVTVFDTSIGAQPSHAPRPTRGGVIIDSLSESPSANMDALQHRQDVLRILATNTDGLAVTNTDLDRGLQRIADDATSYYLLGYYSTNQKLDGKFRALKVRVKRGGVDVRARRGYRAATEAELSAATAAATKPSADVSPVAAAIMALGNIRSDAMFHVTGIPGRKEAAGISTIWVAAEIQSGPATDAWTTATGADIEVIVSGRTATSHVSLTPGQRGFVTLVALPSAMPSGVVQVRAHVAGTLDTERATTRLDLSADGGRGLLYRRGPTTGNRLQPAPSGRFRRTERVHLEVPADPSDVLSLAQLVEKTGKPLAIPIVKGDRTDDTTGQRWLTADLVLAPLAMGEYAIEVGVTSAAGERRTVAAFKIVP